MPADLQIINNLGTNMKTKHSLLAVGLLLAAAVNGFGQPTITSQPADQSVSLGASVKFQVSATSTNSPIQYQWHFAVAILAGQTNSALNLTNVQVIDAGDYDAVLTDCSGSVTSRVATLTVDPTFTKITTGPVVTDRGSSAQAPGRITMEMATWISSSQMAPLEALEK
jgi:hypothetical protein